MTNRDLVAAIQERFQLTVSLGTVTNLRRNYNMPMAADTRGRRTASPRTWRQRPVAYRELARPFRMASISSVMGGQVVKLCERCPQSLSAAAVRASSRSTGIGCPLGAQAKNRN
jgi:hypothetical protein